MKRLDFDLELARQLREEGGYSLSMIASTMKVSRWLVMDRFTAVGISTAYRKLPWCVPDSETVLAYAAGLLDGEGGIYDGKGGHYRISIYNNDERILGFLTKHFAGGLNWRNRPAPVSSGASTRQGAWEVYQDEAVLIILSALYPYLTRKQDQAGRVMSQLDPGGERRDAYWAKRGVLLIGESLGGDANLTQSWFAQFRGMFVDWYWWIVAALKSPFLGKLPSAEIRGLQAGILTINEARELAQQPQHEEDSNAG